MITQRSLARLFQLASELLATTDPSGVLQEANPAWHRALGFSGEELRGKSIIELMDPEHQPQALAALARLGPQVPIVFAKSQFVRKDGRRVWLSWTMQCSPDDDTRALCACESNEGAGDSQRATVASEQPAPISAAPISPVLEPAAFRALADNTTDFVGMADLQGRAVYLNPAGRRMVKLTDSDLSNVSIAHFHPPEYAAIVVNEGLSHAIAHGAWTHDGKLRNSAGELIPVSQVVMPIRSASGELIGFGTIMRDLSVITQFQTMEQELRSQQESLRQMLHAMATPIIPITEHIVVMPLIGNLDTQRAEQFLQAALEGAQSRQAQVVIIDITGLRHIDTSVAALLIRTAGALRLLGAQSILTGVRAEIARTLVGLGVELGSIHTQSTLQSGIAQAIRLSGDSLIESGSRRSVLR